MTHRPFARLAAAATISGLGDGVTQVGAALLAVSLTHSPLRLAGLLVAAGRAGMPLLYVIFLLVGVAGVVYENAATAVLPALVGPAGLTRANGRLQAASPLARSLLAQPLGAWLFTVAACVPFLLDTAGLLLVTFLTATLPVPPTPGTLRVACPREARALHRQARPTTGSRAAPGGRPCARA